MWGGAASLEDALSRPAELAMWARRWEREPPGDPILRVLLARIGCELQMARTGELPDLASWFFWKQDVVAEAEAEADEEEEIRDAWGDLYETVTDVSGLDAH